MKKMKTINLIKRRQISNRSIENVDGYLNYSEKNRALFGENRYTLYRDMVANNPTISSGIIFYLNFISSATWTVTPADDSDQAAEYAEIIENAMDNLNTPWSQVIRQASMYTFYGLNLQEWVTGKDSDDNIVITDISEIPAYTVYKWDLDDQGNIEGIYQRNVNTGAQDIYIPINKVVYCVDNSLTTSPEGFGLLRMMVETYEKIKKLETVEGIGYENDLQGVPIARIPYAYLTNQVETGKLSEADYNDIVSVMEDFISNHIKQSNFGLAVDSATYMGDSATGSSISSERLFDVDLLSSNGNSFSSINDAIKRYSFQLATVMGTEHLQLGQSTGSRSLSQDKSDNFQSNINAVLSNIREVFDKSFIDVIWRLNGFNDEMKPSFTIETIDIDKVNTQSMILKTLASSGAMLRQDDPAINDIRASADIPILDMDMQQVDAMIPRPPVVSSQMMTATEDESMDNEESNSVQNTVSNDRNEEDA